MSHTLVSKPGEILWFPDHAQDGAAWHPPVKLKGSHVSPPTSSALIQSQNPGWAWNRSIESQNILSWMRSTSNWWKDHQGPASGPAQANPKNHIMCLRGLPKHFMNCQVWCCDNFPGEPLQGPTTLWVKNPSSISKLNLPWNSFRLFPQVLALLMREEINVSLYTSPHEKVVDCSEVSSQYWRRLRDFPLLPSYITWQHTGMALGKEYFCLKMHSYEPRRLDHSGKGAVQVAEFFKINIRSLVAEKKIAFKLHSLSSYPLLLEILKIMPCFQPWSDLEKLELWLNCSDAELLLFQNCTNIQVWNWKLTFHPFRRAIQLLSE